LALLALILTLLALSDLTACSLPDEHSRVYWGTQVPVRLLFLFFLTGYTYMFKEDGMMDFSGGGGRYRAGAGEGLKNAVVFTFGFVELSVWFWVFITLRDERRQKGYELIMRRQAEAEARTL
jgi:hypothetical protein